MHEDKIMNGEFSLTDVRNVLDGLSLNDLEVIRASLISGDGFELFYVIYSGLERSLEEKMIEKAQYDNDNPSGEELTLSYMRLKTLENHKKEDD